jgi:hypothetical protein
MITAAELAGVFAAHAIWSVADGHSFDPMLAHTTESGERTKTRLVLNDQREAVERGQLMLSTNTMDAIDAVLVYDGRISWGDEKLDAIIAEMRAYFSPQSKATIVVPYTPPSAGRFLVHKPKLLEWEDCADFDQGAAFEAFFEGVAEHQHGSKIWNDALDESK